MVHFPEEGNYISRKVQRQFTRMIPEIRHMAYTQGLKKLNLTTQEIHRFRGDLIDSLKILETLKKSPNTNYSHSET